MSARANDVRRRVIDAALPRLAADGPVGMTLEDVRRDAGASVGAIYHHFTDKQALIDAVVDDALVRFQAAFVDELSRYAGPRDGVRAMVRFHVGWCADNLPSARLLRERRPPSAAEHNARFIEHVMAWWRGHVYHGAVRDLRPLLLYALWLGPVSEATRAWLGGQVKRPSRAEVELLAEAAWLTLRIPEEEQ